MLLFGCETQDLTVDVVVQLLMLQCEYCFYCLADCYVLAFHVLPCWLLEDCFQHLTGWSNGFCCQKVEGLNLKNAC